jgi:hypothetical protein
MNKEQLTALRDRVAAATGPDRDIDGLIAGVFGFVPVACIDGPDPCGDPATWVGVGGKWFAPKFLTSIDAALELAEELLPGWETCNASQGRILGKSGTLWYWELWSPGNEADEGHSGIFGASAPTAPLAIILAVLEALIAEADRPCIDPLPACAALMEGDDEAFAAADKPVKCTKPCPLMGSAE